MEKKTSKKNNVLLLATGLKVLKLQRLESDVLCVISGLFLSKESQRVVGCTVGDLLS